MPPVADVFPSDNIKYAPVAVSVFYRNFAVFVGRWPSGGVQQVEEIALRRVFHRYRGGFREILPERPAKNDRAPASVLPGIDDVERNAFQRNGTPLRQHPQIVLLPLIGPAPLPVIGCFVFKGGGGGGAQVNRCKPVWFRLKVEGDAINIGSSPGFGKQYPDGEARPAADPVILYQKVKRYAPA
ncbi:hypothetical protein SDC9_159875 [bioreactor metagenome]|uniref:Uncharacterized protein n=1 Tax=bioreactor metagenome TaxID=1076179 RepID=A0A645FE21_9ZZZZ